MGKILLRLIALVSVLVGIFLLLGSLLPRDYTIETSTEIAGGPAEIFGHINTLSNWELWSNFSKQRVEGLEVVYGGEPAGVGAVQKWTDSRGDGKMWITNSVKDRCIEYDLKFANFPVMKSKIELVPQTNTTQVKWSSSGRLPDGPFYGFFALLFPGQMTFEYDQNLTRLKDLVETSR